MRIRPNWLIVAALLSGCGGGGSDGPSSSGNNTPVSVSKSAGDGQSGVVGANLAAPPIVKVLNFNGGGVSGVTVTFTASGGDVLGTTSATTGADGTASAGSWKLGTTAGTHTVTAAAAGVNIPASFTATATPDVAKTLAITTGDAQVGSVGVNIGIAPSVKLSDMHGNGVGGSTVTFTVASGGGSVTGGTVTTSAAGLATVGSWRLGPVPGSNTLTVSSSVAGVAPVTFTATGQADPCTNIIPVAVGATVNGTLSTTDCLFDDEYYSDLYSFTSAAGALRQVEMTSAAFDAWMDVISVAADAYVAYDNNGAGSTNPRVRVLTSPGELVVYANSRLERQTGAYTFAVTAWSGDVAACESTAWIVPGASVFPQTLAATDCALTGGFLADGLWMFGEPGRTYTITMASGAFDPVLRLVNGLTGAVIATDDNSGTGTTARITWAPTGTELTLGALFLTTAAPATSGAYTITVTQTGGAAALSLPPGKARAVRLPAFGGAGAPSVSMQELARRSAPAVRQP
jgi:hypothetical protein